MKACGGSRRADAGNMVRERGYRGAPGGWVGAAIGGACVVLAVSAGHAEGELGASGLTGGLWGNCRSCGCLGRTGTPWASTGPWE